MVVGSRSGVALVTAGGALGYRELEALVGRTARALTAAGVRAGEPVVLCLPNGVRWVAAYLAMARVGAVSVPLNAVSVADEVAYVLDDCGARLALVPAVVADGLAARFGDRVRWWPDGVPTGRGVGAAAQLVEARDVATIAYTSGTTGRPKGALQSRCAVGLGGITPAERLALGAGEVVASALPLAHSYGTNVLNAVLRAGSTLTLLDRFDETRLRATAADWPVTVLAGVPAMYRRLLAESGAGALPSVRCALSAGQSAGEALASAWEERVGGAFVEGWGMTELAGFASLATPALADRHGTAGTPTPGVRLRVRARDASGVGELEVAGSMVTAGYLNDPAATAGAVTEDGWLRTGDVGAVERDGRVRIAGRVKDVILCNGYNVYPAEVERVLALHPAVREAVVAGVPDPLRGESACAWVVPCHGVELTSDQILDHCRVHLAAYKVPRRAVFVSELPLTATGKVSRRELPALTR